jgi:putative aldouronate transport system substrate-binding protein
MVLLIFTGCSDNKNKTEQYDDIVVEEFEPVQLNFYAMNYGSGTNDEVENVMKEIELKLADTIKVKPEFHLISYEKYNEEIATLVNSGKDIDAFICNGPYQFENQDLMKDITYMFPKHAPGYYKDLMANKIGEDYIYNSTVDGKLYSIPYNNFMCPRYCIVARKDLVDKYANSGFETFDDYEGFLRNVKENEENLIPGVVFSYTFFNAYMKGNGYYENNLALYLYSAWSDDISNVNSIERTGEFAQAYSMLKSWRTNDYATSNPYAYYNPFYFSNGHLASQLIEISEVYNLNNLNTDKISNAYEYRIYPMYMKSTHLLRETPRGVAIASCSKNAERVLMFIEWLHKSQENYDSLRYGIKDTNYSLDGEKLIFPKNTKIMPSTWNEVTKYFSDYRYERTCFLDTLNYREVLKEASLNNVKTQREVFEELSDKIRDNEKKKELDAQWSNLQPMLNKYVQNVELFYEHMDGACLITPEMLTQMQEEAGIDKVLEFSRSFLSDKEE